MSDFFDLIGEEKNLVTGPVRMLLAPFSTAIPTNPIDAFDQTTPYAPNGDFWDLGLTSAGTTQERTLETQGHTVEQRTTEVMERISAVERTMTIPVAEITPETLQVIEEGGDIEVVAAGANKGSFQAVGVGAISDLTPYRLVLVAERDPSVSGYVTEPGGETRGPFIVGVYNRAQLAPEAASIEWSSENLASCDLALVLKPDPAVSEPKDRVGKVYFEDAPQTIAAV